MGEDSTVLLAAMLIMVSISAKLVEANILGRLRREVAVLEQELKGVLERLQAVRRRRKSAQGTRDFNERRRNEIKTQIKQFEMELKRLEKAEEEGDEAGGAEGEETSEEDGAPAAPASKEIKVKTMQPRALD